MLMTTRKTRFKKSTFTGIRMSSYGQGQGKLLTTANRIAFASSAQGNGLTFCNSNLERIVKGVVGRDPSFKTLPIVVISVRGSGENDLRAIYTDWLIHYFNNGQDKDVITSWHNRFRPKETKMKYVAVTSPTSHIEDGVYIWPLPYAMNGASKSNRRARPGMLIWILYVLNNQNSKALNDFCSYASSTIVTFHLSENDEVTELMRTDRGDEMAFKPTTLNVSEAAQLRMEWATETILKAWMELFAAIENIPVQPIEFRKNHLSLETFIPFMDAIQQKVNLPTQPKLAQITCIRDTTTLLKPVAAPYHLHTMRQGNGNLQPDRRQPITDKQQLMSERYRVPANLPAYPSKQKPENREIYRPKPPLNQPANAPRTQFAETFRISTVPLPAQSGNLKPVKTKTQQHRYTRSKSAPYISSNQPICNPQTTSPITTSQSNQNAVINRVVIPEVFQSHVGVITKSNSRSIESLKHASKAATRGNSSRHSNVSLATGTVLQGHASIRNVPENALDDGKQSEVRSTVDALVKQFEKLSIGRNAKISSTQDMKSQNRLKETQTSNPTKPVADHFNKVKREASPHHSNTSIPMFKKAQVFNLTSVRLVKAISSPASGNSSPKNIPQDFPDTPKEFKTTDQKPSLTPGLRPLKADHSIRSPFRISDQHVNRERRPTYSTSIKTPGKAKRVQQDNADGPVKIAIINNNPWGYITLKTIDKPHHYIRVHNTPDKLGATPQRKPEFRFDDPEHFAHSEASRIDRKPETKHQSSLSDTTSSHQWLSKNQSSILQRIDDAPRQSYGDSTKSANIVPTTARNAKHETNGNIPTNLNDAFPIPIDDSIEIQQQQNDLPPTGLAANVEPTQNNLDVEALPSDFLGNLSDIVMQHGIQANTSDSTFPQNDVSKASHIKKEAVRPDELVAADTPDNLHNDHKQHDEHDSFQAMNESAERIILPVATRFLPIASVPVSGNGINAPAEDSDISDNSTDSNENPPAEEGESMSESEGEAPLKINEPDPVTQQNIVSKLHFYIEQQLDINNVEHMLIQLGALNSEGELLENLVLLHGIIKSFNVDLRNMFDNYVCFEGDRDERQMNRFIQTAIKRASERWESSDLQGTCFGWNGAEAAINKLVQIYKQHNDKIIESEREMIGQVIQNVNDHYKTVLQQYSQAGSNRNRGDLEGIHRRIKAQCNSIVGRSVKYGGRLNNILRVATMDMTNFLNDYFKDQMGAFLKDKELGSNHQTCNDRKHMHTDFKQAELPEEENASDEIVDDDFVNKKRTLLEKCDRMETQITDGRVSVGRLTKRIILEAIRLGRLAADQDMIAGAEAQEVEELFSLHNFN